MEKVDVRHEGGWEGKDEKENTKDKKDKEEEEEEEEVEERLGHTGVLCCFISLLS